MTEYGLDDLRRHTGELVRRAEAGETLTIRVAGVPAAALSLVPPSPWVRWDEIADVLGG